MANSSSSSKSSDKMSYGITILIFGILFLLQKVGFLSMIPYANYLISFSAFFLIAAIVFLTRQPKKVLGWIFLVVGILLNADVFFSWVKGYSYLLLPVGLIVAGLAIILSERK